MMVLSFHLIGAGLGRLYIVEVSIKVEPLG
jgi:hypothetical protein